MSLFVGLSRIGFHVHLKPLCDASPFFERTFKAGQCRTPPKSSIDLPDDDVDTVDRFISWVYSKTYDLSTFYTEEQTNERFHQLARLNTFADKYNITALSNDIIDRLWEPWELYFSNLLSARDLFCPRVSLISYVYENTSWSSSFRRVMVAWYSWEIPLRWYDNEETRDDLAEVPQDFAVDLAIAFAQRIACPGQQSPFTRPKKYYYKDSRQSKRDIETVSTTLEKMSLAGEE